MTSTLLSAGDTAPPDYLAERIVDRDQAAAEWETLENNGFFPDLFLRDFMARFTVTDDYSPERLLQCLAEAMQTINQQLNDAVCDWVRNGYFDLYSVPHQLYYGNCPERVFAYRSAVYSYTMKVLAERYPVLDTTEHGRPKAKAKVASADYWNGEYIRHINHVLGLESVELEAIAL